ncbi:MAG: hypothetical protein J6Y54_06030 [Lentisphaeria bacterium]|nr:hypothetical protein [Lentisphaeria bacterium]
MIFIGLALVFCFVCGILGAIIVTAPKRVLLREARLHRARCTMLDAVKELDARIFAKSIPADSLVWEFQQFAWRAKDMDYVFTLKNILQILFYNMAQYAASVEFRERESREMSRVPRLNHAKKKFLQGYFQFMECRHPVFAFFLRLKNNWMASRYNRLAPRCREKLAATQHIGSEVKNYPENLLQELGQDVPLQQAA